ncbi:tetratricopeptide (TPR) repeat protein [Xanthomonas arboricola]|uniref:tetratricopeptide repeat protein n=1 Tax=Xanthomonas euroxanthea TaxID=2259622 RepID=UPI00141BC49F|nr:tetratricopeptide repeat protein [Xanthomonas euroxanthea]NIK40301.1 tetratricopeptide (TPR) repeat protein [Xanthomonas euroxanthea]
MIAYVSGEAARAVILRGGKYFGIELDGDAEVQLHPARLADFFGHCIDIERIDRSAVEDVRHYLEAEWSSDRALKLCLIAFDVRSSVALRTRAAQSANVLLEDAGCRSAVLRQLSSAELPVGFDASTVLSFVNRLSVTHVQEVLEDILSRQQIISECVRSWSAIAPSLDFEAQDISRARYRLGKIGVFRDFVTFESSNNDTLLKILSDPVLSKNSALSRELVSKWASKYKDKSIPQELRVYKGRLGESSPSLGGGVSPKRPENSFDAYRKANEKIDKIKKKFSELDFKRADALVGYLVSDQLAQGGGEFVAKSLCNIAMFCRGLGDIDRYFSLTKRAVELMPEDAWALVQLGNAYLMAGNYKDALASFERAEIAGDERSALLGRAEALKAVGQQDVALKTLERCISSYPNDEIAKNARASLWAHFGQLDLALDAYSELIASPHVSAHSYGGRALVFDDLGHTDKALVDIDAAIALTPSDMVPVCAKADILRRIGKFNVAMRVLDVKKVPSEGRLMLGLTAVRVLRDSGDYKVAEKRAYSLISNYPQDLASKVAVADVLRRSGRFQEALSHYQRLEALPGFGRLGRHGLANTFAALGRYDDAIPYLSMHAATVGDWVSKLLLGMIMIRKLDYAKAESILDEGRDCPWVRIRSHFSTALVHLRLRQDRVDEAADIYADEVSNVSPDEVSALLGHHLKAVQGLIGGFDYNVFVGDLFKVAARDAAKLAAGNGFDNERIFESEWLALSSLAA